MIGPPVTNKTDKKTTEAAADAPVETAMTDTSLNQPVQNPSLAGKTVKTTKPAVKPAAAKSTPPVKTTAAAGANEKSPAAKPTGKAAGNAQRHGFKPLEFIVYPAHGVGQIIAIEEQEVAGFKLELFVISFVKDKMILKVPTPKAVSVRMRKLAEADVIDKALETLTGRARIKRTMWSRRAQEYEAKINSGDLIAVAEVVRDLYRSDAQPEQSYSERQLYEAALDRVARELAAVQKLTETESLKLIEAQLLKGPRRGGSKVEEIDLDDADEDGDIEEAA
nr:CarD family transcriptional regulator [Beijerinckia indica]